MKETLNPNLLLAIPLLPLAAAMIAGLLCRVLPRWVAHSVTIAGVGASFGLSAHVAGSIFFHDAETYNATVYQWLGEPGQSSDAIGSACDWPDHHHQQC